MNEIKEVIAEAIKDLQQAQARGIDRRHKEVLVWKACFDLQKLMEKLNESKPSDTRSTRSEDSTD